MRNLLQHGCNWQAEEWGKGGEDRLNARYACDMQKLRFRFLPSGHLVGDFDSPIPRFEKNGVFLWLLLIVVAADTAFPFLGKAVPVTILVKAKIQKNAKCEEEAKSWQGQRKMNR